MILANSVWYDIISTTNHSERKIEGKWLYFGDKELIHSWIDKLHALVEVGDLKAIKVSRKIPEHDPFPQKPCVVCFFTSDDANEKEEIKSLILKEFDINVHIWKSDIQTHQDWANNGWLRIEADLNDLIKAIKRVKGHSDKKQILLINKIVISLEEIIEKEDDPFKIAEFKKSGLEKIIKFCRDEFLTEDINLDTVYLKIKGLEDKINDLQRVKSNTDMFPSEIYTQVKALISKDKLNEAIDILFPILEKQDGDKLDDLIILSSQLSEHEREIRLGFKNEKYEKNRIRDALLKLMK
jgi:hypothetical protein